MRKNRQLKKGTKYHVIAKINRSENIFKNKEMKMLFINIIKRAKNKYKFKIYNFCIMENHIHIIINPDLNENLSKIMQWILSVFAIKFNKIHKITGHLFHDRFFSKIIENVEQFIDTFKYITNNPVKALIVNNPYDYELNGIIFMRQKVFDVIDKSADYFRKLFFK